MDRINKIGVYHLECRGSDGKVKWEDVAYNKLLDEGEVQIVDVYFRNGTAPAGFYIGLLSASAGANSGSIADSGTLATLVNTHELSAGAAPGYAARGAVARSSVVGTGWDLSTNEVVSKTISWTATNDWTGIARFMFLATSADNTGKLISVAQFGTGTVPTDRQLLNGDTLNVTYRFSLD